MNIDEVLSTVKVLRNERAAIYKYWQTSRKKIRPSERAMTLAHYASQIEALDRVINMLLNQQAVQS